MARQEIKARRNPNIQLCMWCLGRQYTPNVHQAEVVGRRVFKKAGLEPTEKCSLCDGVYEARDRIVQEIIEKTRGFEFCSFQLGVSVPSDKVEAEDELRSKLETGSGVGLKRGLSVLLRDELALKIGKRPSARRPELIITIKLPEAKIKVESKPMTVYVRYLKLTRGMPVKAPYCSSCHGVGCEKCKDMGIDLTSRTVEATLSKVLLNAFDGSKVKLSWSGVDEDDSIVVGSGRPMLAQIVSPKRRVSGFTRINMNASDDVQMTVVEAAEPERSRIEDLIKHVRAKAVFEKDLTVNEVNVLVKTFKGKAVSVSIGGNKRKERIVHELEINAMEGEAELFLRLDNAISVRHLISPYSLGKTEMGRVEPNFADVLPNNRVKWMLYDVVRFEEKHGWGKTLIM
jgi:tRNA pseudouridine synthase 10